MITSTSIEPLFRFGAQPRTTDAILQLLRERSSVSVKTLAGSYRSLLAVELWRELPGHLVIVNADAERAISWFGDLLLLAGEDNVCLYAEDRRQTNLAADQLDAEFVGLTATLGKLQTSDRMIIVATAQALQFKIPAQQEVTKHMVTVERGAEMGFEEFVYVLSLNGFERKDFVENIGDIAVRGGIVDIFPPAMDRPLRIEFFGDEIDSIREFDPLSQRSAHELETVSFIGHLFHNDDAPLTATLTDYLQDQTVIALDEPEHIAKCLQDENAGSILEQLDRFPRISINNLGAGDVNVDTKPQSSVDASITALCTEMRRLRQEKYRIIAMADGEHQLARLRELMESGFERMEESEEEEEETEELLAPIDETLRSIQLMPRTLSEGFILPSAKLAVYTEHQIFARRKATARRSRGSKGISLRELQQLHRGDYVVHVDKGVARFDGLDTITVGGNEQECVRLKFAGDDIMYLHMNYVNRLQKFSAQEGEAPTLSKLGSKDWERKKARAKKRLKDIARDLIRLYAKRKMQPGFAFPPDSLWQKELEAAFIYEDTPDQAKATREMKEDMETPQPMDRLVCGDVGFGKTEVAIRGAFKAVQSGKQVAVLAPTTILAQQHLHSFRDRLSRYAVHVEALSRFRTRAEQKEILKELERGTVDVLIGTHRILSKDVQFKELGMLIVDEEQRFGVAAKEKLRQARATVDTLTLTATPIPRTLNFSLLGARDISIIATAPRNRLPIDTEVTMWDEVKIAKAINRELDRGGQIFFVNDKIGNLEELADRLREYVPKLRIGIAHGSMEPSEIERVMADFIDRKTDALVATKIIESGIDIPNVNTILINRADKFGLAELYQLRGRVGRSNINAYCYLMVPSLHTISRKALKRLQALEEFTELGSGFNLALRDLEIRGAGNLLGGEQSGFIADIGFELYQKIVEEAVNELKEEEFADLFADKNKSGADNPIARAMRSDDVVIEADGDAALDKSYIASDIERYEFYKKLYMVPGEEELQVIIDELSDRFGAPPSSVRRLFDVIRLRIAALPTGFVAVSLRGGALVAEFPPEDNKRFYENAFQPMVTALGAIPGARVVPKRKKLYAQFPADSLAQAADVLRTVTTLTQNAALASSGETVEA